MRQKTSSSVEVAAGLQVPRERPIGRLERLAYERAARDRRDGHKRGLWFDAAAADRAIAFFECHCRHYEGKWAGQKLKLEDWQRFRIGETFGWRRKDGTRRFRTSYNEVPRKSGKSTEAGGIGLYLFGADHEQGAQVYCAATKEEQARIVHDTAKAMVRQSPELGRFFKVFAKSIVCYQLHSRFKPLGADSKTQDGLNVHGAIIDETHAHTDRRVWMKLKTAMGAREQPLIWIITTAGIYDPASIGWELHDDAVKVLEGVYDDDSLFAYIAAMDEDDDWTQPATWWKANPNLGISVKLDYLAELCEEAKRKPSFQNEFRQMHCNQWVEQVTRWLSMERWKTCSKAKLTGLEGRACYMGLDLSQKLDLTAACLWFPPKDEGEKHKLLWRYWVPEERVREVAQTGRVPYASWVDAGWLTTTPGDGVDYEFIHRDILQLGERFNIQEIGFDPYNAWDISGRLGNDDGFQMREVRQGYLTLSEPTKEFERMVVTGELDHGQNPVSHWMASNAVIRKDPAGNIKPDKERATAKIDGIVAAIIALVCVLVHEEQPAAANIW
jgi:phage terminase large subunit-like protein